MSKGIYNETYFLNNPEESQVPAVLYCVVLVNKKTKKRECLKIGIAKGTSWKDVLKRSSGFGPYEARIQVWLSGPLEEIYHLEQFLHESWAHEKYYPKEKFGGHTECFNFKKKIVKSIPRTLS